MRSEEKYKGLDALMAGRGGALLATATLLAGSPAAGEDLLQAGLERLMRQWYRVRNEPEIYLRRTIYHLAVDQWRSRRRRPEVLGKSEAELDLAASQPDGTEATHLRLALIQGLAQLGPGSPRRDLVNWYADYTGVYDPATDRAPASTPTGHPPGPSTTRRGTARPSATSRYGSSTAATTSRTRAMPTGTPSRAPSSRHWT